MSTHRIRLYPDDASLPEGWDDPVEGDRECCAACWCPLEMCECGHYGNGDRMDDVDSGKSMGDGRTAYTDDGA